MRRGGSLVRVAAQVAAAAALAPLLPAATAAADQEVFIGSHEDGSVLHGTVDNGGNIDEDLPFGSGSAGTEGIAVSPDGRSLAIVGENDGAIYPFGLGAGNAVTARPPRDLGPPGISYGVAYSPNGKLVFAAATDDDSVRGFRVKANGGLRPTAQAAAAATAPTGLAFTPNGRYLYAASLGSEITIFRVDPKGKLKETANSPVDTGPSTFGISMTPNGRHLYVADNNTPAFVDAYDVARSGRLKALSESPYVASGDGPFGTVISPDGRRLYVANYNSSTISGFRIDGEGQLGPLPGVAYPGASSTAALAINASDSTLFAVSGDGGALAVYGFDSDGVPTDKANSPFSVPGDFQSIALAPAQPPRAKLKANIDGAKVKLSASKSKDDGEVSEYAWKFGDGKKAFTMGPKVTHAYERPGTYTVAVTLTDDDGCSTKYVSSGQTAYCNGNRAAKASQKVKVQR